MISEFDSVIGSCFGQASAILGTAPLKKGTMTKQCTANVPQATAALVDSGFLEKCSDTLTLSRADFDALALEDRDAVKLRSKSRVVLLIEDDGSAPIVTVHLEVDNG